MAGPLLSPFQASSRLLSVLRCGHGEKPTKRTKSIELAEEATRDLLLLKDDLNLDPSEANQIVSRLVSEALRKHGDESFISTPSAVVLVDVSPAAASLGVP